MAFFLLVPSTNPNGFRFSLNCWSWSEELLSKRDRRLNIAWRYSSTLSPVLCRLSLNSRSRSKFDRCVWNLCCSACFIFGQSAGPAERTCIQYQSLACPSTKQWKSCSTSPQLTWYNFCKCSRRNINSFTGIPFDPPSKTRPHLLGCTISGRCSVVIGTQDCCLVSSGQCQEDCCGGRLSRFSRCCRSNTRWSMASVGWIEALSPWTLVDLIVVDC
ncbi:uncharacterized protein LOC124461279 isoform X1 [Drosophila willistoni]|uniref:uncharacterized protein LOC124461279 isoform X1 n=1 Tax=Drosophila willistoni TaxID=7260 RepID=UPI001F084A84|nr:uncharacterized protein LOC124461279 isoform X1 [Drosophila willistoni]